LTCASTRTGNHTVGLENAEDLVSSDDLGLGDTVGVTEDFTDPEYCQYLNATVARLYPYWEGVAPFFASLPICSTTCSGVVLSHAGAVREYGMAEADIPFPLL
jgi:hypothetical protein